VAYRLRLFVAGDGANSVLARAALDEICAELPEGTCEVQVSDVLEDFRVALQENILVTPALIVEGPASRLVIFGNLTDRPKVLAALKGTQAQ
jgi:circadian clock protein KaiB